MAFNLIESASEVQGDLVSNRTPPEIIEAQDLDSSLYELGVKVEEAFEKQLIKYNAVSTISPIKWQIRDIESFHLFHNWAHFYLSLNSQGVKPVNDTLTNVDRYGFDRKVFRLASRLSYSLPLNQSLLVSLTELGIPIYQNTNNSFVEIPCGLNQKAKFNIYPTYELMNVLFFQDICELTASLMYRHLHRYLMSYVISCVLIVAYHAIAELKKLTIAAIRLQYIANAIRNRISRSPTPYKKEPPIGGVKVGGGSYRNHRHVAKTLYLRQLLSAMT